MLWEHVGDNRSGKTFLMSLYGFFDWLNGRKVWANCRPDPSFPDGFDCFLNYPHFHYRATKLYRTPEIFNCTVITDEALRVLESRKSGKLDVIETGYFAREATKADVDWHWDAFEHLEIEKRVRKSWHWQIKTTRIPRDPEEPLIAMRVEGRTRYNPAWNRGYFPNPDWNLPVDFFFPVYNDKATLRHRALEVEAS